MLSRSQMRMWGRRYGISSTRRADQPASRLDRAFPIINSIAIAPAAAHTSLVPSLSIFKDLHRPSPCLSEAIQTFARLATCVLAAVVWEVPQPITNPKTSHLRRCRPPRSSRWAAMLPKSSGRKRTLNNKVQHYRVLHRLHAH